MGLVCGARAASINARLGCLPVLPPGAGPLRTRYIQEHRFNAGVGDVRPAIHACIDDELIESCRRNWAPLRTLQRVTSPSKPSPAHPSSKKSLARLRSCPPDPSAIGKRSHRSFAWWQALASRSRARRGSSPLHGKPCVGTSAASLQPRTVHVSWQLFCCHLRGRGRSEYRYLTDKRRQAYVHVDRNRHRVGLPPRRRGVCQYYVLAMSLFCQDARSDGEDD
ncbi:hypothetical protein C8T65DRAFT_1243 [Cerioporus squamosus]|nr:hypothetical protein C8T65DRAFT_1243 [Cerioporus squamosus]